MLKKVAFIGFDGGDRPPPGSAPVCNEILENESLKPVKLKRHLNEKHDSYANKPVEIFQRILRTSEQQRRSFESEFRTQEQYTRASFEASWLSAKTKKPFNICEELLPAAVKMTAVVHGKKEADEIRKILYRTTLH